MISKASAAINDQPLRNPERVERMQRCMEQMQAVADFTASYPAILSRSMHPYGPYYQQESLLEAHIIHAHRIHERAWEDFQRFAEAATAEL